MIELIAVMAIIIALSLVVIGGYTGMSRAIAQGAGVRGVRDALMLARQHACMNGVRVYVYILDETQYVLCRKIGTVSSAKLEHYAGSSSQTATQDTYMFNDAYTDLGSFRSSTDESLEDLLKNGTSTSSFNASRELLLFDLHEDVVDSDLDFKYLYLSGVKKDDNLGWNLFCRDVSGGKPDGKFFKKGHDYGIALFPIRALPKGYIFTTGVGESIYFEPTGASGGCDSLIVAEAVLRNDPAHQKKVTIKNGKVTCK